jgi:hypothetical protein
MKVIDLKKKMMEYGAELHLVARIPVQGSDVGQPIVVQVPKSCVKKAIAHLHNTTEIPVAIDGNKVIVGA